MWPTECDEPGTQPLLDHLYFVPKSMATSEVIDSKLAASPSLESLRRLENGAVVGYEGLDRSRVFEARDGDLLHILSTVQSSWQSFALSILPNGQLQRE